MRATCYSELTSEMIQGIKMAADQTGQTVSRMTDFFLAGDKWECESADELSDLMIQCWEESQSN